MVASVLIILVCGGLIAMIARHNFHANRDAGAGWQYIYWQPWRVSVIVGGVVFLVLLVVATAVLGWLGQPPAT